MSDELTPEQKHVKEVMQKFFNDFDAGLMRCMKTGEPYRLTLFAERNVTVDIYTEKSVMKKFNENILSQVKKHSGIDIVKTEGTKNE